MLYVSIVVELLRARPALVVWIAALAQAFVWTFVPTLFYSAPPAEVPTVLAAGHEFLLGTYLGPPLAFWLAEFAFDLTGHSMFGVYALSQACVVVTYWAVFALGRAIVGAQHAALAVLLMVGISAFTVPTPDFGPVILTMPLWALILLHYWLAVGEGRRGYWIVLAVEVGLLLLTTYAGLLLIGLLVLFTLVNKKARAFGSTDPWVAGIVALIVLLPHLLWLVQSSEGVVSTLSRLRTPESVAGNFTAWLRQVGVILAAQGGLLILVALVAGFPRARQEPAPVIVRAPVEPLARNFVYYFAFLPGLVATFFGVLMGRSGPVGGLAPYLVLSGLAVIVAAGDGIKLNRQHVAIYAWFGLLLVPPVMVIAAVVMLPWLGIDLAAGHPAGQMAAFFSDSFQRRVGTPLPIVAGDARTAALIALGSPSRPSLFLDATPERSPWVNWDDVRAKGAIVVWPTTDTAGTPPPGIKERFPDIVPEVPRIFERSVQGRLPLLRIGWGLIRPQAAAAPAPAAPAR